MRAIERPASKNPPSGKPRVEDLHALVTARRVGDDKRAVGRDESARMDDAPRLRADVHHLPGSRLRVVDAVDGVRAPIEDEVVPRRRLLEADRLLEATGDVRRQRASRVQNVDAKRREGRP